MDTSITEQFFSQQAIGYLGQSEKARMGLRTGFSELDQWLRGLHNSKLYVVAGRPGDGKTSFGTTLAANVMRQRDFPVLYISTELEEHEIMLQMAEAYTHGISVYPNGRVSSAVEIEALTNALNSLSYQEKYGLLNVVHQKRITVKQIGEWVKLLKPEDDKPFLTIIDQASRIYRDDAHGRRSYTVATEDMLNGLEALGHESRSAIVLLSQLSRAAELQQRPMLSNIKHSGAFEEFAHAVLLLERMEGNGQKKPGSGFIHYDAKIHVAKNRHGRVGPLDFNFRGECHHWTEATGRKEA